ncbi:MAG: galactose mutarotase [Lachnospiraceae bacterium]|nr:galactose mutarotase [Lachnospiraceae bacterium]
MSQFLGKLSNNQDVLSVTLENSKGLKVTAMNYGACLLKILVPDRNGNPCDVLLGFGALTSYEDNASCHGAIVGRNANRIGGAKVTIAGKEYLLAKNDKGNNNLHSGPIRWSQRFWEIEEEGKNSVTFSLDSPDLEQGLPGNMKVRVTYTLSEENALAIHYDVISDAETICNITNHSYFNLNGAGNGNILDHEVWIDADAFTPSDVALIPTGEIRSVEGTPMDFRTPKRIGKDLHADYEPLILAGGYDHNYVLKNQGKLAKVASAYAGSTGISMDVMTDLPGLQMYTGNFLKDEGKNGVSYGHYDGVAFETQFYPDAVHHEIFPQPLIHAKERFTSTTCYVFATRK